MYQYSPLTFQSNFGQGTSTPSDVGWFDKALGYTNDSGAQVNGFGIPLIQGIGGLANAWMGFQNLSLAKKQFGFQRDFANKNFDQQTKLLNNNLYNQYLSRQSYDPERYNQDPAAYMAQWGLKNSSGGNQWTNQNGQVASAAPQNNNQDPNAQNNPMSAFNGLA